MANLTETAVYDAGVYQIETTDPVSGGATGIANKPLINLANRTAFLKGKVDGILAGTEALTGYAKLASPTFTGNPLAPTPALGDSDTSIATTDFVQKTLGGVLSKSVAGGVNVTLTAVEAGNGILVFTGALTASISVIVPTAPTRPWVVFNNTTGAFTLTVKTASGTGVLVPQGKREIVYCDGTNVASAFTDFVDVALEGVPTAPTAAAGTNTTQLATTAFVKSAVDGVTSAVQTQLNDKAASSHTHSAYAPLASPAFTGAPTAPTPAQFDNDTSIATTAFVRRHGLAMAGQINLSTSTVLTAASHVGWLVFSNASSPITLTLPLASTVAAGGCIAFQNTGVAALTISRQSSNLIYVGSAGLQTIAVQPGEFALLETDGFNWSASGTGVSYLGGSFSRSLSWNGYQRFPGGLLIQWGETGNYLTNTAGNTSAYITFPIAFPNACLQIAVGLNGTTLPRSSGFIARSPSQTGFIGFFENARTDQAVSGRWIAIGY